MKRIFYILILTAVFTAAFTTAPAQEKWTLEQCIDYALENNIMIKQYLLNSTYRENLHEQSKNNRLPGVSANVNQGFNFGRSINPDNTYENINSASTGASANANVLIWQGGTVNNTIKQREFELKASLEDFQKAKDDVTLNIASAYLEILFAKELIKVSESQIEQTRLQLERTSALADAGRVARGALLELEALLAREELNLVNRENTLQIAYLNLAQMLELDDYSNFEIAVPEMPEIKSQSSLASSAVVFDRAVQNRPEIRSAAHQLSAAKMQVKIAEGARMPTLSASAAVYTDYYNSNQVDFGNFSDQFNDNLRESVGLNLSIPVFSRFNNRTNIANAKLQLQGQELELEAAKKELRRQIEQAHVNALAAMKRFTANRTAVESMVESFRYVEEKYSAGRVSPVEYNDAKTNLGIAESDLIQAKYEFIFRSKILDFYNGIPISL